MWSLQLTKVAALHAFLPLLVTAGNDDRDDYDESMVFLHSRYPSQSGGRMPTTAASGHTSLPALDALERDTKTYVLPDLDNFFPQDYDRFSVPMPPSGEDALSVVFSVKVRDIFAINEGLMDITLEWYIRMYWTDYRLQPPLHAFVNSSPWINIDPAHTRRMWLPTAYIDHAKEIFIPSLLVLPHSLRITKQGLLRYSTSVITKIACPMDFTAYPFDKQVCYMRLEGYQYRTFEVEYSWHESAIQISKTLKTDHFTADFQIDNLDGVQHENSTFPSVQLRIILFRKMSYHLMNTYIPSGLFVIVSWLTFFVPVEVVPGRMVLTITTLLTMVSMFSTVREESPKVSYAKAIDMWMFCCIILVFTVLVEYTFVIYLHFQSKKSKASQVEPKRTVNCEAFTKSTHPNDQPPLNGNRTTSEETSEVNYCAIWEVRLEKYTVIFLSSVFVLFNLVYWSYWLSHRNT